MRTEKLICMAMLANWLEVLFWVPVCVRFRVLVLVLFSKPFLDVL